MKKVINLFKENNIILPIIVLLYMSIDTIIFGTNSNLNYLKIQYVFIFFITFFSFVAIFKNKKINRKLFLVFISFALLSMISMIFNYTISFKYFYEIALLFIAMTFVNYVSFEKFKNAYVKAIIIIACVSLIPYILNIIVPNISNLFPTITNSAGYRYHNYFISVVPFNENQMNIYRNASFFREPGVYSIFLNIAIFFLLFSTKKGTTKFNKYFLILVVNIITTFSTGGIITTLLLIIIYMINGNFSKKKIFIFIIISLGIITFLSSDYAMRAVFGKLYTNNGSIFSRNNSIWVNLNMFMSSPIYGLGWEKIDRLFVETSISLNQIASYYGENSYHNTNTLLKILSVHGFIYFSLFIYGITKFCRKINKNLIISLFMFITFFILVSNEDIILNIILPIIMFYGYQRNAKGELKNEDS